MEGLDATDLRSAAGDLVKQQERRLEQNGAGHCKESLFPTAHVPWRISGECLCTSMDEAFKSSMAQSIEQIVVATGAFGVKVAAQAAAEEQGFLRHHSHSLCEASMPNSCCVDTIEEDPSLSRGEDPQDGEQEGALPGSRLSGNGHSPPWLHVEDQATKEAFLPSVAGIEGPDLQSSSIKHPAAPHNHARETSASTELLGHSLRARCDTVHGDNVVTWGSCRCGAAGVPSAA
mmetsp:Transcript_14026/g.30785  ORF Transcript_14026/g.30785 Transcript_14026/m.30785 type:complete len:232 (-) Transcript_14026:191-886(-)